MRIADIQAALVRIHAEANSIVEAATAGNRSLTADETARVASLNEQFANANAQIATVESVERMGQAVNTHQPRIVTPAHAGAVATAEEFFGFDSGSEFFKAVRNTASGVVDPRLIKNAGIVTYGGEGTAADGGNSLYPQFIAGINAVLGEASSLWSKLDPIPTTSNVAVLPVDTDADWSTTMAAATVAEGASITATKPAVGQVSATLAKQAILVPVTNELIEDSPGIDGYILRKAARKMSWRFNSLIKTELMATGSKRIATPKGATGAAAAPSLLNVQAMLTNLHSAFRQSPGCVWLANPLLETQFQNYSVGNFPVFIPAGGMAERPFSKLYGIPVVFFEGCNAIGAEGDLILADLNTLYGVTKSNGLRVDIDKSYAFDQDMTMFRFIQRVAVKSKLAAAITKPDATTCSNVVTVAVR